MFCKSGCDETTRMSNADNRTLIAGTSGITAIFNAMTLHNTDAAVQQTACGALKILALNADNKDFKFIFWAIIAFFV